MEDKIYKAIQVKTPEDNPQHGGLFETNYGRVIFRDGKWLFDDITSIQVKELYWHKQVTKEEYEKDILSDFLDFLLSNGYCDSDVYDEPPTAIDQYLIFNKK